MNRFQLWISRPEVFLAIGILGGLFLGLAIGGVIMRANGCQ